MHNTNDLSDEQHGLRQKYNTGMRLYMKKPTVNVKVNGFRNKKQFSYNVPLRYKEAISCRICLHEQHYFRIKYNEHIDIGAKNLLQTLTFVY